MDVRVRTLTCGWIRADAGGMVPGQTGTMRMPVGAFLIEHPDGTAVFDTGMHPELEHTKERLRSTAELSSWRRLRAGPSPGSCGVGRCRRRTSTWPS